jgi:hypothetical protein
MGGFRLNWLTAAKEPFRHYLYNTTHFVVSIFLDIQDWMAVTLIVRGIISIFHSHPLHPPPEVNQ